MGELSNRMLQELRLRGRTASTIRNYLRGAKAFARFHMRSPAEMGEAEVRAFLAHLTEERKLGPDSFRCYIASLKFLYGPVLGRPEVTAWVPWPKKPTRLPTILSQDEVARLIRAAGSHRLRAMIMCGYGAGLRMSEVQHLRPLDIDSKRGCIHVHGGKGNKDRIALLPDRLLAELREYWRTQHPTGPWLFPGNDPQKPLTQNAIYPAFHRAMAAAGLTRPIRFHSLRHAFATHLLEGGASLLTIQAMLGHADLKASMVYLRVRADHLLSTSSPLDVLPAK